MRKPSSLAELKRKQTTAVVLLGVIGAEFGQDITSEGKIWSCFGNIIKYPAFKELLLLLKLIMSSLYVVSS